MEKESINWRSRRDLTWSDFKGKPVETAPNAAMTSTSILIDFNYDNTTLKYHLSCVFYPEKSWTKVSSSHILGHEQGHFDISELYTRKLHKALSEYSFRANTVDKDIKAIYERIAREQSAYQALYDQQTNYSRNTQKQEEWQGQIISELNGLSQFSAYP
ncbi:DUF922 domain-containing protein [Flavihumibacter fluvii]|uniref:DUF922 domain-containing protein n=1 Tax=Flavihumibacter fluvii TaxID=2838157 RepID=UPI001BDEEECA|nr:DUF922 domain-containing protein [Flavihumibacter fluvii]ULQ50641.1 DUF922 domain-containing protein [Flavihumibacter fluvii]